MGPRLYPDESGPPPRRDDDLSIDPQDRPFYGEEPPPRGLGNFLRLGIYGLVAVGCAAALWYAFTKGKDIGAASNGTVPLIRADQGATKVKPDQPGGEPVPDQDKLVYNPAQPGAKVERLLPPPEQPLAKPLAPPPSADASAPLAVQEIGPSTAPKAAPPSPAGAALPPVTASGSLVAPPSAVASPSAPPAPVPPPAVSAPAPTLKPAQAAAAASGNYRVQIAATKDAAAAHSEWERLKKAHADLLGALSPTVVKADLGDKGVFYRVQAGPVADRDKAEKLCSELKKFAIACLIVKP